MNIKSMINNRTSAMMNQRVFFELLIPLLRRNTKPIKRDYRLSNQPSITENHASQIIYHLMPRNNYTTTSLRKKTLAMRIKF